MTLKLGKQEIKGHDLKVVAVCNIKSSDLSGINTSTTTAFEGFKPKRLQVSLNIKFNNPDDLKSIKSLYETTEHEDLKVYDIFSKTAEAIEMRKGRFDADLRITEDASLEQWHVNFTLLEVQSIPELKQKQTYSALPNRHSAPPYSHSALDAEVQQSKHGFPPTRE